MIVSAHRYLYEIEDYRAHVDTKIGIDRKAAGLPCTPDPVKGDLDEVQKLRKKIENLEDYLFDEHGPL